MEDVLLEFRNRLRPLENLHADEAYPRITGFCKWLNACEPAMEIVKKLDVKRAGGLLDGARLDRGRRPPKAATSEEIAAVGFELLRRCEHGGPPALWGQLYHIQPIHGGTSYQEHLDEVFRRYVRPFFTYVEEGLEKAKKNSQNTASVALNNSLQPPPEIAESLGAFWRDHPEYKRNAFVMMRFGSTPGHDKIVSAIRKSLKGVNIFALRADDKQYHDDLFPNVLTYIYGCSFGIAVFERLETDDFNPNVSLEVGYMRAMKKHVCLLKDRTLKALQTDLVGKLYRDFDPQDPQSTIGEALGKWINDKELASL